MLWYTRTKHASWRSFIDLRSTFPSADRVGRFTVFDIKGGSYRLICRIEYELQKVFIRHVLTHEDYDREKWKDDEWF
ncbi:MAG TPA: type II toxin-antitoxin system HigB family toxin [Candidatus Binatia bacterium]|nr:type II toxin-antitoxin system HigB family toxin [Candidatus Binatia bacterium]